MENIALNTIFYIMLFIFPGLLFRKFYFGGEFTKQFQQGNLIERLLWTLFFSVLLIILSSLSIIFLQKQNYLLIEDYISYETIKKLFDSLSINKLPEEKDIDIFNYLNFLYLILTLYLFSCVLGYVSFKFIRITNLDNVTFAFKFKNYWHYLLKSNKVNGEGQSKNKYLYTNADVLVEYNNKQELFSGYVQDYYIDPITNKLDCIVLKNTFKFIAIDNDKSEDIERSIQSKENIYEVHKVLGSKKVYKKYIPGDIMTIFSEKILNLNLTYIEQVLSYSERKRGLKGFINFSYYLFFSVFIIFPWIFQYNIIATIIRKVVFSFVLIILITFIKNYIFEILKFKDKTDTFLIFISKIIFYSISFFWLFKILNAWQTSIVMLFWLIIITFLIAKFKPKDI